eukprot:scaffold2963_cov250-Pinguiococcus_pyrenoidosus.AAC.23
MVSAPRELAGVGNGAVLVIKAWLGKALQRYQLVARRHDGREMDTLLRLQQRWWRDLHVLIDALPR